MGDEAGGDERRDVKVLDLVTAGYLALACSALMSFLCFFQPAHGLLFRSPRVLFPYVVALGALMACIGLSGCIYWATLSGSLASRHLLWGRKRRHLVLVCGLAVPVAVALRIALGSNELPHLAQPELALAIVCSAAFAELMACNRRSVATVALRVTVTTAFYALIELAATSFSTHLGTLVHCNVSAIPSVPVAALLAAVIDRLQSQSEAPTIAGSTCRARPLTTA